MTKIRFNWRLGVFLITIFLGLSQNSYGGGFYLPEVGSPGSVGTAGVANVVNNFGTDSALTNPAGMTGLKRDQVLVFLRKSLFYKCLRIQIAEIKLLAYISNCNYLKVNRTLMRIRLIQLIDEHIIFL
jgi:hypothetical protein